MRRWFPLILLAVGLLIYAPSLGNSFVLDDEAQVLSNSLIHSPANVAVFFSGATMHQESNSLGGIYYKPIMSTIYSVLWWLTPGESWSYHLFQLLLVIANAMLAFIFLRRMMNENVAALMALIYLVHPINSEVVVYIADLQDGLYTFFGLLAMNALASRDLQWKTGIGFGLCLFAALLSKESGVLFLVLSLVYAVIFCPKTLKKVGACVLVAGGIYLYLRFEVANLRSLAYGINQIGRAPFDVRLYTAPLVMGSYFWKFIFPRDLTVTQDWVVSEPTLMNFWLPSVGLLTLLGLSLICAVKLWKKGDRRFAFFTYWVFMGMGFHSHLVASLDGTVADRWFYFSSLGLLGMLGLLIEKLPAPRVVYASLLAISLGLGARSYARSLDWENNFVLCDHDLKIYPDSYDLHNNLGVELFRRGRVAEAKVEFERSVALTPIWDINWNNLGAAFSALGDDKNAEQAYLRAMANGGYYMAFENYATLLVRQHRMDEAQRFVEQVALPRFPLSQALRTIQSYLRH